jgi:hypothetical protein
LIKVLDPSLDSSSPEEAELNVEITRAYSARFTGVAFASEDWEHSASSNYAAKVSMQPVMASVTAALSRVTAVRSDTLLESAKQHCAFKAAR